MIRERQYCRHLGDPPVSDQSDIPNTTSSPIFHNCGGNLSPQCTAEQVSRTLSRFAARLRTLSTSSLPVCVAWGVSCLGTYRGVQKARAKPSVRLVARPTKWSKPSSPTSPKRFGLRTLRLRSPRFVAAAFVPLNAISAANENGRVSPSRSSSPRSCVVTPCEISRSFPSGSHRPF